jgi:AAA15 family ATPase/GTPase
VSKLSGRIDNRLHDKHAYCFVRSIPRDDDDNENISTATTTKKRKSDAIDSTSSNTKTLLNYFSQKNTKKTEINPRRLSGSAFFRAAQLKAIVFPM